MKDSPMEPGVAREMTVWKKLWSRLDYWLVQWRRKFPYLVWYDDELDVTVTFREDPIRQGNPLAGLFEGHLPKVRQMLGEIGIEFDQGQGFGGRDWEWDYSLRGPISVRFRRRAERPWRRR